MVTIGDKTYQSADGRLYWSEILDFVLDNYTVASLNGINMDWITFRRLFSVTDWQGLSLIPPVTFDECKEISRGMRICGIKVFIYRTDD